MGTCKRGIAGVVIWASAVAWIGGVGDVMMVDGANVVAEEKVILSLLSVGCGRTS